MEHGQPSEQDGDSEEARISQILSVQILQIRRCGVLGGGETTKRGYSAAPAIGGAASTYMFVWWLARVVAGCQHDRKKQGVAIYSIGTHIEGEAMGPETPA